MRLQVLVFEFEAQGVLDLHQLRPHFLQLFSASEPDSTHDFFHGENLRIYFYLCEKIVYGWRFLSFSLHFLSKGCNSLSSLFGLDFVIFHLLVDELLGNCRFIVLNRIDHDFVSVFVGIVTGHFECPSLLSGDIGCHLNDELAQIFFHRFKTLVNEL